MDDYQSEFSSIENQVMANIPIEQNNDDIQDLANFPRDSFVDHTPYNYVNFNNNNNNNNNGYTSSSSPFQQQNLNRNSDDDDDDDNSSNDDHESGYSTQFKHNNPSYEPMDQDINNNYSLNTNINVNQNMNQYNHNYNYEQLPISESYDNSYKSPKPEIGPIPQDSEFEEDEGEIIPINNSINNNYYSDYNQNITQNNMNIQTNPTPTPIATPTPNININKKSQHLEQLYQKCKKYGTPPPDADFSLEGWKLFYPPNERFFLWEKGKVIPNRVLVYNEKDPEKLEIYEGEINKKNERHGIGILTSPKYVRKGTWRDGEFTGWCRESRINGDIFEGKFIDGAIYGKGINKNHKGNLYVGDFVDNKREGKGELKTKRIHYEGDFKFDKFNGKGKLEFLKEGHSYEGEFKNNEIDGIGVFKWSNGDIYEGEMTNGKMNGYGKYTYSNGQIYEGNYVNGVKEGLGKLIYPNNKVYEGEFKNGKPMGEGTIYANGKKLMLFIEMELFRENNGFL